MQSKAATVDEYLASLPPDRRAAIEAIRNTILANLGAGYEECMAYGMISYHVPLRVYPAGYHANPKQGLPFAAIASQKNYISIYLMGLYCGCADGTEDTALVVWFKNAWAKSGKRKLDMGKACIRIKKLDEVPLEVLGEAIRRVPAKLYIETYEKALNRTESPSPRTAPPRRSRAAASKAPSRRRPTA